MYSWANWQTPQNFHHRLRHGFALMHATVDDGLPDHRRIHQGPGPFETLAEMAEVEDVEPEVGHSVNHVPGQRIGDLPGILVWLLQHSRPPERPALLLAYLCHKPLVWARNLLDTENAKWAMREIVKALKAAAAEPREARCATTELLTCQAGHTYRPRRDCPVCFELFTGTTADGLIEREVDDWRDAALDSRQTRVETQLGKLHEQQETYRVRWQVLLDREAAAARGVAYTQKEFVLNQRIREANRRDLALDHREQTVTQREAYLANEILAHEQRVREHNAYFLSRMAQPS